MLLDVYSTPWGDALRLEQKVAAICAESARYGWLLDSEKARIALADLEALRGTIDREVVPLLPPKAQKLPTPLVGAPFKKNGELSIRVSDWLGENSHFVAGPFSKVAWEPFNLESNQQVKDFLLSVGWEPDEWNTNDNGERTSPKLTESSLNRVEHPLGRHISHRETISHRMGLVAGLLERVRPDGRLPSEINTLGTGTGRATHRIIVNIPKAKEHVFFGKRLRELFIVPDGYHMVGFDAKGLQLRCLAHYINNPSFTQAVIAGDPHQENADILEELCPNRDVAKNILYALIFGAKNPKLAETAGFTGNRRKLETIGAEIRRRILTRVEGFLELTEGVQYALKTRGYLLGLDGRKVYVRQEHKALNTLLQNMESIVMKVAMCFLYDMVKEADIDAHQLTWQHDEIQSEVRDDHLSLFIPMAEKCIPMASEFLKSNCPLSGDVRIGKNWANTH